MEEAREHPPMTGAAPREEADMDEEMVTGLRVAADEGGAAAPPEHLAAIQGALRMWGKTAGHAAPQGSRPGPALLRQSKESRMRTFRVTVDDRSYVVTVDELAGSLPRPAPPRRAPGSAPGAEPVGERLIQAPIPGKILDVRVAIGGRVTRGDVLLVLEAMKMENDILAPGEGTVKTVRVRPGDTVNTGDVMLVIE
jgi:biotin carboxyl carrier protein